MHAAQVGSLYFRLNTCVVFRLYDLFLKDSGLKTNQNKCEKTTTIKAVKTRTKTVYLKKTVQNMEIVERGRAWLNVFQ